MQVAVQHGAGLVPQWLQRIFASRSNSRWQVAPAIDIAGYGFSWVLVAVPVFLFLDDPSLAGFLVFLGTSLLIHTHRHFTFSYVYMDRQVRRGYPVRFLLVPAICLFLWTQTPALARSLDTLAAAAGGAGATWLWLTVQILWQDQGGPFQWRAAIPLFLGGVATALALAAAAPRGAPAGWIWLGTGVAVSLLLHVLVSRDAPGEAHSGRRTHWVFPGGALAIAALTALASLGGLRVPLRAPASVLMLTFAVWQTYHVLMQKYGILRIYNAKSGQPEKVPGWVDRLLIFSVVPTFLIWAGSTELENLTEMLSRDSHDVAAVIVPPLRLLGEQFGVLMSLGGAFWAACAAIFAWYEWRVHRLRHAPRLWFAAGTLLMYASLFPLGILNSYVVVASSHGIEYMVFVWAFQRRRYRDPAARQAAGPLLRHPAAAYATFTGLVVAVVLYVHLGDRLESLAALPRMIFAEDVREWFLWYTLYQGVLHFYYDGFLWRLRRPSLLAQV